MHTDSLPCKVSYTPHMHNVLLSYREGCVRVQTEDCVCVQRKREREREGGCRLYQAELSSFMNCSADELLELR